MTDPIPLAQALMRCASVTPLEGGALDVLQTALKNLGFRATRYKFGAVDNLYARLGTAAPNFCFAGHADVVPPGDGWTYDPFAAEIRDGVLYGRGAADMKTALAAMAAATKGFLSANAALKGSISFLVTCDEEGPALDGTKRVLAALKEAGEKIDHCIVGEPTSEDRVGDIVKNGRRGSLNCVLSFGGKQGHVAYPHRALNPVTPLIATLVTLKARQLDEGAPGFDPSNLEITSVDVANTAHNVIPQHASAKLNIRFNTRHAGEDLIAWIRLTAEAEALRTGATLDMHIPSQSAPFYTPPGAFTQLLGRAITDALGAAPHFSTTGGTSDARFLKDHCVVAEFGLRNATAHMVDEHVPVEDVRALAKCYEAVLTRYFGEA